MALKSNSQSVDNELGQFLKFYLIVTIFFNVFSLAFTFMEANQKGVVFQCHLGMMAPRQSCKAELDPGATSKEHAATWGQLLRILMQLLEQLSRFKPVSPLTYDFATECCIYSMS